MRLKFFQSTYKLNSIKYHKSKLRKIIIGAVLFSLFLLLSKPVTAQIKKRFSVTTKTDVSYSYSHSQTTHNTHTGEIIKNYIAYIEIYPSAKIHVLEHIEYDFGNNHHHGIQRIIPYLKTAKDGKQYRLEPSTKSFLPQHL